jgi:hypothetical protein
MDWFVARNGKSVGPLMLVALVEGARRGLVEPEDYVLQPGADKWERAKDVPELWATPLESAAPRSERTSWIKWATRREPGKNP